MQNKDFLHKLYGWRESYFVSFVAFFLHIAIHKESKKSTKKKKRRQ